jgi:hypothetical protein
MTVWLRSNRLNHSRTYQIDRKKKLNLKWEIFSMIIISSQSSRQEIIELIWFVGNEVQCIQIKLMNI